MFADPLEPMWAELFFAFFNFDVFFVQVFGDHLAEPFLDDQK